MRYEDIKGEGKKLSPSDIEIVAGYLGCEVAMIKAILKVESAGKGFGSDGRPIIRFEGHQFRKYVSNKQYAEKAGLAGPVGVVKNPQSQADRYEKLLKPAMLIDGPAALRACSWGLGQVMGFNYDLCNYNTLDDFVRAQCYSEGAQLMTMARYIVGAGLQRDMKAKNFLAVARGYNGKAQKGYDAQLAKAYNDCPARDKWIPSPATQAQIDAVEGRGRALPSGGGMQPENPQTAPTGLAGLWRAILRAFGVIK